MAIYDNNKKGEITGTMADANSKHPYRAITTAQGIGPCQRHVKAVLWSTGSPYAVTTSTSLLHNHPRNTICPNPLLYAIPFDLTDLTRQE